MPSPGLQAPYFDELAVGQEFTGAPGLTLTPGLAAARQAITGERLPLMLDHVLCREVTGAGPLAPPGLVWDVAIGQSTVVTQRVKANLFYRGLVFHRTPELGDTLRTRSRVLALKQNSERAGRAPTGLAVLQITTTDQHERPVLDFSRCAMLPLRDQAAQTGHADDLDLVSLPAEPQDWSAAVRAGGCRCSPVGYLPGRGQLICGQVRVSRWPAGTWCPAPPNWPGSP